MGEIEYESWWGLHRRVVTGGALSDEERQAYEAGLADLETEEWASLTPSEVVQPLQRRLRELSARIRQLAQEEMALRDRALQLEHEYAALTGEPLSIEV
jgi:hypothetical protein